MIIIQSTYRLIALMMAFLMLFTSVGFTMDMHYCKGELKSVSFFGKAKPCHESSSNEKDQASMQDCPHHKKLIAQKESCSEEKNCCSNKTVHIQSDQDQAIQKTDFVVSKPLKQFVVAYVAVFLTESFELELESTDLLYYKPPLIQRNIPVLHQTFLL